MENENVKKNNTKPIILGIIGVLVVLLIAMGIVYKLRAGNPVTITTAALERLGEGVDKKSNLGKIISFMEEADTLETSMTGEVKLPMDYGTINLDMLIAEDADDREAIMDLDVKLNGEKALYLEGQLDKDALYFAFKENASKYYYMTDLYYPEIDDIDYEKMLNYFTKSFEEVVTKEDFKASKKEITVNDVKLNAKQYSLELSEKLAAQITNSVLNKILKDADLVEDLAKLAGMTESEIREELNNMKTSDEDLKKLSAEAYALYNIYVAKNKAVRYEFADVNDANNKIYIDNYKNVEIVFNSVDSYNEKVAISIKEEKENWVINVDSSELKVVGTVSEEKYDLTITAEGMNIIISGTEEYKFNKGNIELLEKGNIKITQDGASIEVPYEFTINLKDIDEVTLKNTTNKIDINNMTPEEETEFSNDLMQIPLISSLMSVDTGYEDSTVTDYNYDYTDEYSYTEDYGYGYGY